MKRWMTGVMLAALTAAGTELLPFLPPGAAPAHQLPPELVQQADQRKKELLALPLESVTFNKKLMPPSGDIHDYISRGRYWWPNPDTPNGLPYIRRDGHSNPEVALGDNPKLARLRRSLTELGQYYYCTRDPEIAAKAVAMLRCWFIDPATRMNPNMRYSQEIPGVCEGRIDTGLIDSYALMSVLDAIYMLGDAPELTAEDRAALRQWFREFLAYLRLPEVRAAAEKMPNNIGAAYRGQLIAFGFFSGEKEIAADGVRLLREAIDSQIRQDGAMPHELTRTRSLDYSTYAFSIFVKGASYARHCGEDLFRGRLLQAAEFLLPYMGSNAQKWPHPQFQAPSNHVMFREAVSILAIQVPESGLASRLDRLNTPQANSDFYQIFLEDAVKNIRQKTSTNTKGARK